MSTVPSVLHHTFAARPHIGAFAYGSTSVQASAGQRSDLGRSTRIDPRMAAEILAADQLVGASVRSSTAPQSPFPDPREPAWDEAFHQAKREQQAFVDWTMAQNAG